MGKTRWSICAALSTLIAVVYPVPVCFPHDERLLVFLSHSSESPNYLNQAQQSVAQFRFFDS
jgi:hypothetical protein